MKTYQERVNDLAEKLAAEMNTRDKVRRTAIGLIDPYTTDEMLPLAAIALQEMAEVAKDAVEKMSNCDCAECQHDKQLYIHSLGLIPEKTK
jgi:hypothetical protein